MENKLTRLARLVERRFPYTNFTSRDVVEAYQSEYGEQISLSTASTYLSRLAERGFLERAWGSMNNIRYRLPRERAEEVGDAG
jgi:predicted transcriptional regulator